MHDMSNSVFWENMNNITNLPSVEFVQGVVRLKYARYNSTYEIITKTSLYNFDPFKPRFYTVKQGFTGVYIIFLISAQKYTLWVLVRTASSRRF